MVNMQVHGVICNTASSPAGSFIDAALIRKGVREGEDQWNWWKLITTHTVKFSMLMMIFAPRDLQFCFDKVSYFLASREQTWQLLPSLPLMPQINHWPGWFSELFEECNWHCNCILHSRRQREERRSRCTIWKERERGYRWPPVTVTNVEERTRNLADGFTTNVRVSSKYLKKEREKWIRVTE